MNFNMATDAFFLPAVIALGVVSTLQDFRVRRISNLWIILSLLYAIVVHICLFISKDPQETLWSMHVFINVWASLIVAIYFWKQNWWGGGDAKLFVCYAALIPLSHYPFGYFSYYFYSFLLLIITFVPAALWTFFHAQINLIRSKKSICDDFRLSPERFWEFIQLGAGFTAILFVSNLFILVFNGYFYWIKDFPVVIWLLGIGFYKTIFRLFQHRLWLVLMSWVLGICAVAFVPFFHRAHVGAIFINSVGAWMLIFILRQYMFRTIEYYVELSQNNNMAFAGWMFLGGLIIWFSKLIPQG